MYKILIAEDDPTLAKVMKKHIESWNMNVHCVKNFRNITDEFREYEPHLVLLDIMLPFYNGYHWCTQIRQVSQLPIIFLSSMSDDMNIVMAVSMGGDDFIPKPFTLEVLTAKVQALLRRSYDFAGSASVCEHNGAILNLTDATLMYEEQKVELTKNELRILQTLFENKEKIVSRDALMTKLWENDEYVDENTLSVNVNRLRKKLATIGLEDFIVTKKGIGYRIG